MSTAPFTASSLHQGSRVTSHRPLVLQIHLQANKKAADRVESVTWKSQITSPSVPEVFAGGVVTLAIRRGAFPRASILGRAVVGVSPLFPF